MKTAIITGASSGMGREAAIQAADRFSGLGEIWVIARRKERLESLRDQLPVPLRIFPLDLSSPQAFETLERALREERPEVKLLINAAGYGKIGPVSSNPTGEETGMVRLNCEALCAVTSLVLPFMTRESRIIQFASAAAFLPQPDFAVYAATKAFVLSYSRALNAELRPRGIAVTAVCPGPVKTEFFDIAESHGTIPLYKRLVMADPKKVVRLALRDSMMGRELSVYGPLMKAFHLLTRLVPHSVLLRIMEKL
ncbi:MAG: SDR family NAD(P)-dependent oxidoreductase [Eubacteriales bacterium]|nr:SDR family NAD(P)-dependent oxidoreductase [Eubacteriales bacterium]